MFIRYILDLYNKVKFKKEYFFHEHYESYINFNNEIELLKCISPYIKYNKKLYYLLWSYDNEKELNNAKKRLDKCNIRYILGSSFNIIGKTPPYEINDEYTGIYVIKHDFNKSKFIEDDEMRKIRDILIDDPFGD